MTRKIYTLVFFSMCHHFFCLAAHLDVPDYYCEKEEEVINPFIFEQEVEDQGDLGICFIHSSLQTYRGLYEEIFGKKIVVSPLYAALYINSEGYKRHFIKKGHISGKEMLENVESGLYPEALNNFKRLTPCAAKKAEEFLGKLTKETSLKAQIEKANKFLELYARQGRHLDIGALKKEYGFDFNSALTFKNYLFRHGFEKEKWHLHKKSFTKTLYKFFLNLGKCSEKRKLSLKVKSFTRPQYSKEKIVRVVNQHLTKKTPYPFGLSYQPARWSKKSREPGNHSSLIYGKTCRKHKLYYLVRNSWGGKSLKQIRKESAGDFAEELKASRDRSGDFWINPNLLKEAWTEKYGGVHMLHLNKRRSH